jgi:hypothetical protein
MKGFARGVRTSCLRIDPRLEVFHGSTSTNGKTFEPKLPLQLIKGNFNLVDASGLSLKEPIPQAVHHKLQFIGDCIRKQGALSETGAAFALTPEGIKMKWSIGEAFRRKDPLVK